MVVNGIGLSTAYGTVISGVDDEQDGGEVRTAGQHLRNGQRMQIVRMADGSEFALPAAPRKLICIGQPELLSIFLTIS